MRPVFGFCPSALDAGGIADAVVRAPRLDGQGVGLVVTPNVDHIRLLRRDPEFASAYADAALVTCDGFPVAFYARTLGWPIPGRVTGCDIARLLLCHPGLSAHRVFILADSDETLAALTARLAARGVAVAGAVPPRGFEADAAISGALAERVSANGSTILLLGVGAPRSELFVARMRARLPACWALCVGQALRIEAGLARRAPASWQGLGVEWLWRLASEPRRLAGRYAVGVGHFALAVMGDLLRA